MPLDDILDQPWLMAFIIAKAHNAPYLELAGFAKMADAWVNRFASPDVIPNFHMPGPLFRDAISAELAIRDYLASGEVQPARNSNHNLMGKRENYA